jgi:hypothetical protein
MTQTTKLYFKSEAVTVRDATISDVFELARNMRPADISEIWKSHHRTSESSLMVGYSESVICLTAERKESPIAMLGIVPHTILGKVASIWLLASPELEKIQKTFLRNSRVFIDLMLEYYPILINWVDVENRQTIKWLKWCGAELGPVVPYGVEQQPFQYFQFRRKNNV